MRSSALLSHATAAFKRSLAGGWGAAARGAPHALAASSAQVPTAPVRGYWAVRAALVRGLPSSFAAGALRMDERAAAHAPIDPVLAAQQHEQYNALLRTLLPRVVEVDADEAHPDCVFIEDTAIVTPDGVAIVTRPGEPR